MLNKRLKSTRLSRGLTQVEAAKALGVTQAFLSKLELGGAAPNVAMLKRIAKLYDVTARTPPKPEPPCSAPSISNRSYPPPKKSPRSAGM